MPTRIPDEFAFNLASYARLGSSRREQLTPTQKQQVARTVGRTPEVMVKVLSQGSNSLVAVRRHIDYIGRDGKLDLESDDGQTLRGRQIGQELVEDWDLELDALRRRADLVPGAAQTAPRLVHKLMFSMPPGTPPAKVLQAVQNFCREEFLLQHRYAMALHTDEPHPHVHVVVKAISEQGDRLYIRKETLRNWRAQFAQHLRAIGVAANATQRYVRGPVGLRKPDEIYRAAMRGQSKHMHERTMAVAGEISVGAVQVEREKEAMIQTRGEVRRAWHAVIDLLVRQKNDDLAQQVRQFVGQLPPVMTDKEYLAAQLLKQHRDTTARRDFSLTPSHLTPPQKSR